MHVCFRFDMCLMRLAGKQATDADDIAAAPMPGRMEGTILLYNSHACPFLDYISGISNNSLDQETLTGLYPFIGQFPKERGIVCIGQKLEQLGRAVTYAFLAADNLEEIAFNARFPFALKCTLFFPFTQSAGDGPANSPAIDPAVDSVERFIDGSRARPHILDVDAIRLPPAFFEIPAIDESIFMHKSRLANGVQAASTAVG
nr:hypothetical protein [Desulfopila sp. IMCC35008]